MQASLRLWQESESVRTARVNELILQMNLERCRNRELRFLSNGERRRVAIASQVRQVQTIFYYFFNLVSIRKTVFLK